MTTTIREDPEILVISREENVWFDSAPHPLGTSWLDRANAFRSGITTFFCQIVERHGKRKLDKMKCEKKAV